MLIRVAIAAAAEDTAGRLLRESRGWKMFINFISQVLEICRNDLFERSVMKPLYLRVFALSSTTSKTFGGRTHQHYQTYPTLILCPILGS